MNTLQIIIFWILLVDSLATNLIAWVGSAWYASHFRTLSRILPLTKAWALFYLVLVLWIGHITLF